MKKICIADAKKLGTELFPIGAIAILEKHYRGGLDNMPVIKKVTDLMGVLGDDFDHGDIRTIVIKWADS